MKKVIIVIASITAICVLLTGIFSAGLVVGGLILSNWNIPVTSQITPSIDVLVETATNEAETSTSGQPDATPPKRKHHSSPN